jgi:hypothetical protein
MRVNIIIQRNTLKEILVAFSISLVCRISSSISSVSSRPIGARRGAKIRKINPAVEPTRSGGNQCTPLVDGPMGPSHRLPAQLAKKVVTKNQKVAVHDNLLRKTTTRMKLRITATMSETMICILLTPPIRFIDTDYIATK